MVLRLAVKFDIQCDAEITQHFSLKTIWKLNALNVHNLQNSLRGMSVKFMDSRPTAQLNQRLASSSISSYSIMYQEYICEKNDEIQVICLLQRFYYRHHATRGAGACIYHDIGILKL